MSNEVETIAEQVTWVCFHCGFQTSSEVDAAAHFGDRDDERPLCWNWRELDEDGKASEYQSTMRELNDERDENARLHTAIEGLEHRVEGQLSEIKSFKPFRECTSINEIFHVYDSMEGRALLAEQQLENARQDAAPVTICVGTSCLTRDLVWCECHRGISLTGKWIFCPSCGRRVDQKSYESAVEQALNNGGTLFRHDDTDTARLQSEIEKLKAELESARQDTERLRAALTAAINSLRPIVDCGVTDRPCLACREDVKALFGKLAEFDAARGVQGNSGEPKRD